MPMAALLFAAFAFALPEPVVNQHPAWSPDGRYIAFVSNRTGNAELYVVDVEGANLRQVTDDPREDSYPSWSPDGESLVFHSGFDRKLGLYLVRLSDGDRRALTEEDFAIEPRFSPDGRTILFSTRSAADGSLDVHTLDLATGDVRAVTSDDELDGFPSWAGGDGQAILFHSRRNGVEEIFRQNLDGSSLVRLSTAGVRSMHGDTSPDGSRIVFDSERTGDREIWVMSSDGSGPKRLTESPGRDGYPRWSPDGRRIAFHSERHGRGRYDIYVMESDGTRVNCLTCEGG